MVLKSHTDSEIELTSKIEFIEIIADRFQLLIAIPDPTTFWGQYMIQETKKQYQILYDHIFEK